MNDQWVEVSGFPEYEVHPRDGVRRKGRTSTLRGRNWIGYPKVTLMRDGRKHERRVHRLVADHFLDNPNSLPIVNHKDTVRSNFAVDNLEWTDNSGNQLHRWGTQKSGVAKEKYAPEYGAQSYTKGKQMGQKTLDIKIYDKYGSEYKADQLPLQEQVKLRKLMKTKTAGWRGKTTISINGRKQEVRIEKKGKEETHGGLAGLKKSAVAVGRISRYAAKTVKKTHKGGTLNLTHLSEESPRPFNLGGVVKGGLGLSAAGGLAAVAH